MFLLDPGSSSHARHQIPDGSVSVDFPETLRSLLKNKRLMDSDDFQTAHRCECECV